MIHTQQQFPSFGTWLEHMRGASTLSDFALEVGVDKGTISRTERECTEVSVASVIRICQGLNLSLSDLFAQWLGRTLPDRGMDTQAQRCQEGVLNIQDAQQWLARILDGHRRSRELLIAALNLIVLRSGLLATPLPPLSQLFSLADIEKMLWDLPWFHFEVAPPLQHEPLLDILPSLSRCDGLILPSEIGAYLAMMRKRRNMSFQQVSDQSCVSVGTLTCLESGKHGKLRMYDLLRLDDCLELNGELVHLYWWEISSRMCLERAWAELQGVPVCSTRAKHGLVSLLTSVGRWLQFVYQDDTVWLATIRHGIGVSRQRIVEAGVR